MGPTGEEAVALVVALVPATVVVKLVEPKEVASPGWGEAPPATAAEEMVVWAGRAA